MSDVSQILGGARQQNRTTSLPFSVPPFVPAGEEKKGRGIRWGAAGTWTVIKYSGTRGGNISRRKSVG